MKRTTLALALLLGGCAYGDGAVGVQFVTHVCTGGSMAGRDCSATVTFDPSPTTTVAPLIGG